MTDIEISRDRVFAEVSKLTGYAGAKSRDSEDYCRLAVTGDDDALLQAYWQEAFGELYRSLRRTVAYIHEGTTAATVGLRLSGAVDTGLAESLGADIESYVVHSIVGAWLQVARADDAESHARAARATLEAIGRKALTKSRPVRPRF